MKLLEIEQKYNMSAFLMPPHLLTNFKIQKCFQNKPKFNGIYSRHNLH